MRPIMKKLDVRQLQAVASQFRPFLNGLSQHEAESAVRFKARVEPASGIRMEKKSSEAHLYIYESIGLDWWTGEGMTPAKLQDQLEELRPFDSITVHLNSGGGDVFDGYAIFNVLRSLTAEKTVEVEGIAASAASFIAQAADPGKLLVHEAAQIMVHNSMGGMIVFDNADTIEREAAAMVSILRKIDKQVADIYAARSGRPASEWAAMMDRETFMTGQEAVDERFADELIALDRAEPPKRKASNSGLKLREIELRLRSA